jgi:hypothetical protein
MSYGGGGVQTSPGSYNTPGWKTQNVDTIEKDKRGFDKIMLKRNNNRVLQSSLYCLQAWRANCDISFTLHDSNPKCPNTKEIAAVTDYVVRYACKGNKMLDSEKKNKLKTLH